MHRYKIYGIILESEFELNLLVPAGDSDTVQDVITVRERDVETDVIRFLAEHDAVEKLYEIGLNKSAFYNRGGFYLIQNGNEIWVKIKEGYDYDTISVWITGFCLSIALLQRGVLTIHCSAVSTKEGAVLISGTPGAGKSSLAGKLLETRLRLLADDVAGIRFSNDECLVYPAFPFQKLCSNEIEKRGLDKKNLIYINEDKDKYLVPVNDIFEYNPQKANSFFYIIKAPVEELTIRKLSGFECFMSIRDNLFLHRLKGSWENSKEVIDMCMKTASKFKIYLIIRPENKDTLDEIYHKVLSLI
ncbi:MAG: hypothetical protein J5372_05995 [Lachnospiraceae bacterium]|nr:hypothetical protein [Lachnospiraceae bacterium]